jgi:hypothetical protein
MNVWISDQEGARCAGCGDVLKMVSEGRCLKCAGLGDLEFLPSGDPALTRRATTFSARHALVMTFNRRRKREERRGTLLEPAAIEKARASCAADAVEREEKAVKRRARDAVKDVAFIAAFTAEIRLAYPGCPAAEAEKIARHACEKHSGRVGRSAAAKELDAETVTLAVRAHIRHEHTEYDRLRDEGGNKRDSRSVVRESIDQVAARWKLG